METSKNYDENDSFTVTTFTKAKLKKGEYFRKLNGKTVYIYQGKPNKGYYSYCRFDDCLSSGFNTKTDLKIEIGFSF